MKIFTAVMAPVICAASMFFGASNEQMCFRLIRIADCTETAVVAEVTPPEEACTHSFGEFILVDLPTEDAPGLEVRTCSNCQEQESRDYFCEHRETVETVTVATCATEGRRETSCGLCRRVLETEILERLNCSYGDWIVSRDATPVAAGERYRECSGCGERIVEAYTMSMPGENSIYIPGTGIQTTVAITGFTQSAVDNNDVIYSNSSPYFESISSYNPFVLGHNTGTMGNLSKVEIGQHIYLSVNGNIKTYEVKISEFAMQNSDWTDIIGQTSGYSVFDNLGAETLHMYTCYGGTNGRWMVLATLI